MSYFEKKEWMEMRGKVLDQQEELLQKARDENRDLTSDEQKKYNTLDKEYYDLTAKIGDTGDETKSVPPQFNGSRTPSEGGVRLLKPEERFYDNVPHGGEEIAPGSFLRAAMVQPKNAAEREAVQRSVTSSGYSLPVGVASQVIDDLRQINPAIQAGARTVELPQEGETKFVRIDDYPNTLWHAELTDQSTDSPTFGAVTMQAKTLLSLFEVSRELEQDSANLEEAIRLAFTGALNDALVTATFTSQGGNAPTGLDSLVSQTEEYTNGGSPTWATMIAAQKALYNKNVPKDRTATIHDPNNWADLTGQTGTDNHFIDPPRGIADVPEFVGSGVPDGVSYTGDFSNLVYGFRMNIGIDRFPSVSAKKFGALWVAALRVDTAVFQPDALLRIEEAAS